MRQWPTHLMPARERVASSADLSAPRLAPLGAETPRKHVNATASCRETENGSAPGPAQDARRLTQYKELAANVGVARYGSKTDLVSRIKGVSGGKDKLQTLIDKAKKSIVAHKKKKAAGSPKKKTTSLGHLGSTIRTACTGR